MLAAEITWYIAMSGLLLCVLGLGLRIRSILHLPYKKDLSRPQGNPLRGVLYAFTLGMAPWEKESTRLHWMAYIRGIIFHLGVFAALGVLFSSPWLSLYPAWLTWPAVFLTGVGALAGFAGIGMRRMDKNLRILSLRDDYFSVFMTSLFTGLAFLGLLWQAALPVYHLVAGLLLIYIPFSKIRHCLYFFFAKFIFGRYFGQRGVLGQPKSQYSE
jgi:hypothetical protein